MPKPERGLDDPRFQLLKRFFHESNSPIEHLTPIFLHEADINRLDWRLLPSLASVESSAGKSLKGNNLFGWNNGDSSFRSIREGIHFVADRLANGRYYRGKSVRRKLQAYNSNQGYIERVEAVMARISGPAVLD